MFISETPRFEIHRLYAQNSLRNYTYLILEKATGDVTIVDPWEASSCLEYLHDKGASRIFLLNTHQHLDHTRGNAGLLAAGALRQRRSYFEEWSLPGHTAEHVVFWLRDGVSHLFCGDTLFQAGVGNCKNGGDPEALYRSIQTLRERLTPETFLHVGHDYLKKNLLFALQFESDNPAINGSLAALKSKEGFELPPHTWEMELAINPFLRLSETTIRQSLKRLDMLGRSELISDKDVFIQLRYLRDHF